LDAFARTWFTTVPQRTSWLTRTPNVTVADEPGASGLTSQKYE
jgi:hypothetical protein